MHWLICTCIYIFFTSAVFPRFDKKCHQAEDKVTTRSLWTGQRMLWGTDCYPGVTAQPVSLPRWAVRAFLEHNDIKAADDFPSLGDPDPWTFTASLNCSHGVCSPQASITLTWCKDLVTENSLHANNTPHWHQGNNLSTCLSSLILSDRKHPI